MEVAVLSDAEARLAASKLMQLNVDAKALAKQKAEIQSRLTVYVEETENTEIGEVLAYQKASPPKLVSTNGTPVKKFTEALVNKVDESYVIEKLNVKSINENKDSDSALKRLLRSLKVSVEQTSSWHFKHVS